MSIGRNVVKKQKISQFRTLKSRDNVSNLYNINKKAKKQKKDLKKDKFRNIMMMYDYVYINIIYSMQDY